VFYHFLLFVIQMNTAYLSMARCLSFEILWFQSGIFLQMSYPFQLFKIYRSFLISLEDV